jgi:hypothetical protein
MTGGLLDVAWENTIALTFSTIPIFVERFAKSRRHSVKIVKPSVCVLPPMPDCANLSKALLRSYQQ